MSPTQSRRRGGERPPDGPPSEEEYSSWIEDSLHLDNNTFDTVEREKYSNAADRLLLEFRDSMFWASTVRELDNLHAEYEHRTDYGLLAHPGSNPIVVRKPWSSIVLKSYRRNIR